MARKFAAALVLPLTLSAAALLTGCGAVSSSFSNPVVSSPITGVSITGRTYGGQQPVNGATIQLYAAATTGYGLAAAPLIASAVTSNASGGFSITGAYTCPSASTLVYVTATGGNPGLSATNPNLAMMAALGPCGSLSANTFIQMNEVTTVAGVYALSGFMSGATKVSSSSANAAGMALAFADVNLVANIATGVSPGTAVPAGATVPSAEINTLANILSACINSAGGTAGDGSNCGKLFTAATPPGGAAPTDTLTAALNIAHNPSTNVATLYALSSANPPFQPSLSTVPNDWTVAINYTTGGFSTPSAVAIDASGNVWVTNSASNTVTELAHSGTPVAGSPFASSATGPSAIAIDTTGGPWIAGKTSNTLVHLSSAGAVTATATGGGLNAPSAIAIDMNGAVFAANSGANIVSEFTSTGAAISTTGFTVPARPLGVAISRQ